jgi:hypothetical protein
MQVLGLFKIVLRIVSGGFMLSGLLGTLGGLYLLASPEATIELLGTPTKAPGPKALFTCVFGVIGVVGLLLWVYGPRLMFGFIERAMEERGE